MRSPLTLLLLICILKAYAQGKSFDYCYTNTKGICVYSVAEKKEYIIIDPQKGSDPCISPDGTKIAYTANFPNGDRNIAVVDINTRGKVIMKTESTNCYGPTWSPDGKYLAYNVFDEQNSRWLIAIIDAGNTSNTVLTAQLEQGYMPTWSADSRGVVVQNLDNIYVFDLDGNITTTYKVADMDRGVSVLQDAGPSSSDKFVFTNDNSKIVFSSEANEPGGSDGPPTAVFVYDIANKHVTRLSPTGYFAGGVFVKGDKVMFTASKLKSTIPNVYVVDIDGKNLKLLFANCADISAKN
jgi:TolB protein